MGVLDFFDRHGGSLGAAGCVSLPEIKGGALGLKADGDGGSCEGSKGLDSTGVSLLEVEEEVEVNIVYF